MAPRRLRDVVAAGLRWASARAAAVADRLTPAAAPAAFILDAVEDGERPVPGAPEHWLRVVRRGAPQLLRAAPQALPRTPHPHPPPRRS